MENVITDNKNHFTKFISKTSPHYPCNIVDNKYKASCYMMQTSVMLDLVQRNFSKVFELCENATGFETTCYQSLGRDASGSTVSNAEKTKQIFKFYKLSVIELGKTAGESLVIKKDKKKIAEIPITKLADSWTKGFVEALS